MSTISTVSTCPEKHSSCELWGVVLYFLEDFVEGEELSPQVVQEHIAALWRRVGLSHKFRRM